MCFSEQGSTNILLCGAMLMQQIEQSPPALTISLVVASLEAKSMKLLQLESFAEQQQQAMISTTKMRGERKMRRTTQTRGSWVSPTTTTYIERSQVSTTAISSATRVMIEQIMVKKDIREQKFSRFLTQGNYFRMIELIAFLAMFRLSLRPSSSRSLSRIQFSPMQIVELTQFQIFWRFVRGSFSTE